MYSRTSRLRVQSYSTVHDRGDRTTVQYEDCVPAGARASSLQRCPPRAEAWAAGGMGSPEDRSFALVCGCGCGCSQAITYDEEGSTLSSPRVADAVASARSYMCARAATRGNKPWSREQPTSKQG